MVLVAIAFYGTVISPFVILFLGIALREVWQSAKDMWVQRRNSVAGDYDTKTTGTSPRDDSDREDSGTLLRTLRLSQRGRRVAGEEKTQGGKTKWRILGEAYDEFVVGTWEQISPPAPTNKGAFHVQRDPRNGERFFGQWIGWVTTQSAHG